MTLQQPIPDEMYYAFSKTTESCTGLGQTYSVNITTGESRLEFTVNVGESGLDTRQEVYLVSWYTMNGVMGPCSNELMNPTGMHVCWGKDTAVAVNCWAINVCNRLFEPHWLCICEKEIIFKSPVYCRKDFSIRNREFGTNFICLTRIRIIE